MTSHHHCHEVRHIRLIMVPGDNNRTSLERSDESAHFPSMWHGFVPVLDFKLHSLLVLYPDPGDSFPDGSGFPLSLENQNLI